MLKQTRNSCTPFMALFLSTAFFWGAALGCMKQLNHNEKYLLMNQEALVETIREKGWPFNDRIFSEQKLSHLVLSDVKIKNVKFFYSFIENLKCSNVIFKGCEFWYTEINNVTFTNCTFYNCKMYNNKFNNCKFRNTKFSKLTTKYLKHIKGNDFEDSEFYDCRFEDSSLENMDFYGYVFENLVLDDCELAGFNLAPDNYDVKFTRNKNTKVLNCHGKSLFFSGNNSDILVEKCKITGVGFCGFAGQLTENVKIIDSKIDGLSFRNNNTNIVVTKSSLRRFHFLDAEIRNVDVKNCAIRELSFHGTKTKENCLFKDSSVHVINFYKSVINGLVFENVGFDIQIQFWDAIIENMSLKNTRYLEERGPLTMINPDKVKYINSDQFPTEGVTIIYRK